MTERLPVEALVPAIDLALAESGSAVLVAEPGAGKTTVVPWRLARSEWLGGGRVVMLEPRRIAARAAAARIAWHLGETVGETAGYRVRFDSRISARTRIEVVTEGVLTRMLADDPALERYGLVILDEFHERSVQADLALALTLQARAVFRPELRILVMSATIDAPAVAGILGGAPVVAAPGRIHPIQTCHRPPRPEQRLEQAVVATIREALGQDDGDVLVFLPGVGEIRRVAEILALNPVDAAVVSLHGSLSAADQDAALTPARERRVILATAIAETSLTVPAVRIVIDAGLMRVPRFSPRTGMTRLETVRVTKASADQRRGRAGRTAPGVCYRLWAPAEELGFVEHRIPEIRSADLAPLLLDLAAAGVRDPAELTWLDRPPGPSLSQARDLLTTLGALDAAGALTGTGREMAALPLHPRLGHLAVRAREAGQGALAAVLVALLSDRDIARRTTPHEVPDVDIRLRLEALETGRTPAGFDFDRGARHRLLEEIREWRRRLGVPREQRADPAEVGRLLTWAYPDRIAARRGGQAGRFLLVNGRGASIPSNQPLAREDWLVAVELEDSGPESRIGIAAPLDGVAVEALVDEQGVVEDVVDWDPARRSARAIERTRLGAITVTERPDPHPDPDLIAGAVLEAVRRGGLGLLTWTDRATSLRDRLAFLHLHDPGGWPDVSDEALLGRLEEWLRPAVGSGAVDEVAVAPALAGLLDHQQRVRLDRDAPEHFEVPTGSRIRIDYRDPAAPVLPVRLQEMFGVTTGPAIAGGRVPLTVHLLSPAGRPLQVTRDLAGFWKSSYFDVRREMRGRYPKHHWPENPLEATPTRKPKQR